MTKERARGNCVKDNAGSAWDGDTARGIARKERGSRVKCEMENRSNGKDKEEASKDQKENERDSKDNAGHASSGDTAREIAPMEVREQTMLNQHNRTRQDRRSSPRSQ